MSRSSQPTELAPETHDDLRIVQGALRGEPGGMEKLFARLRCVPRILAAINRRFGKALQDADLADLAQETLTKIWSKLDHFQGTGPLDSWAYRFCFLELMNRLRHHYRWGKLVGGSLDGVDPAVASTALEYQEVEERLDELGPPEADVVRLKHLEGMTFPEIGRFLQVSPNTAKTYYYRGIDWLRSRLARTRSEGES